MLLLRERDWPKFAILHKHKIMQTPKTLLGDIHKFSPLVNKHYYNINGPSGRGVWGYEYQLNRDTVIWSCRANTWDEESSRLHGTWQPAIWLENEIRVKRYSYTVELVGGRGFDLAFQEAPSPSGKLAVFPESRNAAKSSPLDLGCEVKIIIRLY